MLTFSAITGPKPVKTGQLCHSGCCWIKDQTLNWVKVANTCWHLNWYLIRNINESFLQPKLECEKQDPGYVGEVTDCVLHAAGAYSLLLSTDVGDGLNYIVYHNSNYSNKQTHQINASNYNLFQIKALYKFEL